MQTPDEIDAEIDAFVAKRQEERRVALLYAAATGIDTGDHVYHKPSGETWLVRRVTHDGWLQWCGWPPGETLITTCILVYKATPAEKAKLQQEIAASEAA